MNDEYLDCGHPASPTKYSMGYGILKNEKTGIEEKHCFNCCAAHDREQMVKTGRATLYLVDNDVINWPGTLRFHVWKTKVGKHNWGIKRYDVWFYGPDNMMWHGVKYGDNTQVAHCKKTKIPV